MSRLHHGVVPLCILIWSLPGHAREALRGLSCSRKPYAGFGEAVRAASSEFLGAAALAKPVSFQHKTASELLTALGLTQEQQRTVFTRPSTPTATIAHGENQEHHSLASTRPARAAAAWRSQTLLALRVAGKGWAWIKSGPSLVQILRKQAATRALPRTKVSSHSVVLDGRQVARAVTEHQRNRPVSWRQRLRWIRRSFS